MIKGYFTDGFFKSATSTKFGAGKRIYENDLIEHIEYEIIEGNKINIDGRVISESLYNTYSFYININFEDFSVLNLGCTCQDFEKNELKKKNYACKHISAAFLRFLDLAEKDQGLKTLIENKKTIEALLQNTNKIGGFTLDTLINNDSREETALDIYINRNSWSKKIGAEFKIGPKQARIKKRYVLKDIDNFLVNLYNNIPIPYSRDFEFKNDTHKFTLESKNVISFIETIKEMEIYSSGFKRSQDKLINKKEIIIPKGLLRSFFSRVKGNKIYLNTGFYSREVETEILECDIPLPMELKETENSIDLSFPRGIPEDLSGNFDVFLYDTVIYLPSMDQCERLKPYLNAFKAVDSFKFNINDKEKIFKELIPSMRKATDTLILNDTILEQIVVKPPKFKFYFHREDYIKLTLKVCYGEYEFNILNDFKGKFIYRDKKQENFIINTIKSMYFEPIEDKSFVFIGGEDLAFRFFKSEIDTLRPLGEIFYSDGFKGKIDLDESDFNIEVSRGREDYFNFKYSISDIEEDEYYNILRSFKDNKKYYKLNSGDYLDLEEIKIKELLSLINTVDDKKGKKEIEVPINKGIYVNEKLKNIIEDYKGKKDLEVIEEKLLNTKLYKTPSEINATLRDYQVHGLNWFKQLKDLGFGGILGDEMGLGKTLQAISFITLEKSSKTLIVAPTSLIYNWRDEFSKFSKDIKVGLAIGVKGDRRKVIDKFKDLDVIITTYNLLRNDLEIYEELQFDLMFIDEGQYIKNPQSKNAKACKKINTKSKFALTGTPIENNLMELWSIFDFLMPGYLYDKNTFNSKYNRNLSEDEVLVKDLRKLISPFILRRLKRDVLKELPEKIEKVITVDMTKEQKRVYSSYVKYINELIERKVSEDEFKKDRIEILSYITKLRQIALDPSLVSEHYEGESGKILALKEILKDTVDGGHKILLFSQFTKALKNIKQVLDENDISNYYLDGSVPSKKRSELVTSFNEDNTQVFLISLKAGGTGLNLTSADVVIHFDPWWNPAAENQATDRAHRIGQQNVVEVIKLISEGTVEEKILNLQSKKLDLVQNLIDPANLSNNLISSLTKESLLELINK